MIYSMKRVLHCKFSHVITANRIEFSKDLMDEVLRTEGEATSMVPVIDYKPIKHVAIPRLYSEKDVATTEKFRKQGLSEALIQQIQRSTPGQRQMQEEQFAQYVSSPHFHLPDDMTLEEFTAAELPPFFPMTYIPESAVPQKRVVLLDEATQSYLYSLAAQMPYPKDVEYEPLFGSYIESCMNILSDGISVDTSCTIYYNYRLVTREVKIIFYLTVVHARRKDLERCIDVTNLGATARSEPPVIDNGNTTTASSTTTTTTTTTTTVPVKGYVINNEKPEEPVVLIADQCEPGSLYADMIAARRNLPRIINDPPYPANNNNNHINLDDWDNTILDSGGALKDDEDADNERTHL